MNESSGDKETQLDQIENDDGKRRLWRNFRVKLWLSSLCNRFSIRSRIDGLKTVVQKNIVSASIAMAIGLCYLVPKFGAVRSKVVPYSDLLTGVRDGNVTRVQFVENSRRIKYTAKWQSGENAETSENNSLARKNEFIKDSIGGGIFKIQLLFADVLRKLSKEPLTSTSVDEKKRDLPTNQVPVRGWQYSTRHIGNDYSELLSLMKEKGTRYGLEPEPIFVKIGRRVLTTVLNQAPSWAMLFFVVRGFSGTNSTARKPNKRQMVTFDDVEGVDAAKTELMEIVSCLQGDLNYENLGAKLPRGVLLVGPPGTGKTLLARAVAEKAGVPFFVTCASEFVEMFVGRGASRIRDLFREARKCAPSIIFIDELDAVGQRRGRSFNTEGDQTLNQLLTEMDGFESDKKVVVIAATNRVEMLDPALLRPGRFSRKVFVTEPDEDGRRKILAVHFRGVPLEEDRNHICNLVASVTEGLVGADLANIVNEAALLAARRGGTFVSREDIRKAIERAKFDIDDLEAGREFDEEEGHRTVLADVRYQTETQDRM